MACPESYRSFGKRMDTSFTNQVTATAEPVETLPALLRRRIVVLLAMFVALALLQAIPRCGANAPYLLLLLANPLFLLGRGDVCIGCTTYSIRDKRLAGKKNNILNARETTKRRTPSGMMRSVFHAQRRRLHVLHLARDLWVLRIVDHHIARSSAAGSKHLLFDRGGDKVLGRGAVFGGVDVAY